MGIDLHIHTTASDGDTTPLAVLRQAQSSGISILSITDHESIDGFLAILDEANRLDIQMLPGLELLTEYQGREVHLLGYLFDYSSACLVDRLTELRALRNQAAFETIHNLRKHGFDLNSHNVARLANGGIGAIGKNHIIQELVNIGHIHSQADAVQILRQYLSRESKTYVEFNRHSLAEAQELIRTAGGIPVLAHPGILNDDRMVEEIIRFYNLPGIEVYYAYFYNQIDLILKFQRFAQEWGLLATGGSDYHGKYAPVLLGAVEVPTYCYTQLIEYQNRTHEGDTE